MPAIRSKQIALAGAALGLSAEQTIQVFITSGLLSLATHNEPFRLALLRSSGVDWDDLASADSTDVLAKLMQ
jgi:hypothetical protein